MGNGSSEGKSSLESISVAAETDENKPTSPSENEAIQTDGKNKVEKKDVGEKAPKKIDGEKVVLQNKSSCALDIDENKKKDGHEEEPQKTSTPAMGIDGNGKEDGEKEVSQKTFTTTMDIDRNEQRKKGIDDVPSAENVIDGNGEKDGEKAVPQKISATAMDIDRNEQTNKGTDDTSPAENEIPKAPESNVAEIAEKEEPKDLKSEEDSNTNADPMVSPKKKENVGSSSTTESGKKKVAVNSPPARTSARQRKSIERLSFDDSATKDKAFIIVEGCGDRLGDIESVQSHIKKLLASSDEIDLAHWLLYKRKGKLREMKKHLFDFTGFSPKNCTDDEKEKLRHELETRCYRIRLSVLKQLMDMFDLERSGSKEKMVARLLNFLASPSADQTKSGQKIKRLTEAKKRKSIERAAEEKENKKGKTEEVKLEDDESSDSENDSESPSKKKLMKWIEGYLVVFKLEDVSLTHALELASRKFDVDLHERRSTIKELLKKAL